MYHHLFSNCHRLIVIAQTAHNTWWQSVLEGAGGGLVAAGVLWGLNWLRDWKNRPIFNARWANPVFTDEGQLVCFDLFFKNEGRTAFLAPVLNVDGLTRAAIQLENEATVDPNVTMYSTATWTPEGNKIVYTHGKPLIPQTSFRWRFKVLDVSKLPDTIQARLLHEKGVEPVVHISMIDLKIPASTAQKDV